MILTWYGHACFLAETAAGSVVFDPYAPGSVPGLTLPPLRADAVVCSHGHRDHAHAAGVTLSGRKPDFTIRAIPSFHDDRSGTLRGENRIHVLEADGLRLVHMGDLGHMLSEEQLAAVGKPDVLLIPVGGHYTIGPAAAEKLVRALRPRLTIPMHYRGEGFGYDVIGPVEDFTHLFDTVTFRSSNVLDPAEAEGVVVLRCPV
ncbi:MAG: MBL fold metallo-hydrolase [Oscillospiraceae bacterium]|nr:MBL fold metallo-hydrolase [Oscillospiraceae bacterium]